MKVVFFGGADDNGGMQGISTGINSIGIPLVEADHNVQYYPLNSELSETNIVLKECDLALIVVGGPEAALPKIKAFKEAGAKVVAITDGVSQYLEVRHHTRCALLLECLRSADVVLVNSSASQDYYKVFLDNPDKVKSIGFPIQKKWILKASSHSDTVRNESSVYQGFAQLTRSHHNGWFQIQTAQNLGLQSVVTAGAEHDFDVLYELLPTMFSKEVIVKEHTIPGVFLDSVLSNCGSAMYFPQRPSLGRTAAECAVLGIPSFGTRNYFQEALFPMLTFDEIDGRVGEVVKEVMANDKLRQRICDDAMEAVDAYLSENYYMAFMRAIGEKL